MRITGPYNLRKGVLTEISPGGIFLLLTEIEDNEPRVEVYFHPGIIDAFVKSGIPIERIGCERPK